MILVTGGCGYIGSHIVKRLSEAGEQVLVFDNLSAGRHEALLHGETLVVGDITDSSALDQVFTDYKVETVIHCAALVNAAESVVKEAEYVHVNDTGSRMVWESALRHGVTQFIYASSAAVYGTPPSAEPIVESAPLLPTNPYGSAKLSGEQSLIELSGSRASYVIFRFFNVGGADQAGSLYQSSSSRAILQRIFAVAKGSESVLTLSGHDYDTVDGTVVRDFIHVEDIVSAVTLALTHLRAFQPSFIANLGTGVPTSLGQLISLAETVIGQPIPITYAPRVPGDIVYSLADNSLAKQTLGWQIEHKLADIVRDGWNAYVHI